MSALIDFFKGLGNSVLSIFDFILVLFEDFIGFVKLLGVLPEALKQIFSIFPDEMLFFLGILFSVVIVYKILGRD